MRTISTPDTSRTVIDATTSPRASLSLTLLRTQRRRELAHVAHVLEAADERDDALHRVGGKVPRGRGAQLLLDLRPRQRIGGIALRCRASIGVDLAVGRAHFHRGARAFDLGIDLD